MYSVSRPEHVAATCSKGASLAQITRTLPETFNVRTPCRLVGSSCCYIREHRRVPHTNLDGASWINPDYLRRLQPNDFLYVPGFICAIQMYKQLRESLVFRILVY